MERAELKLIVRATGCAVEHGGAIFVADPAWTHVERAAAEELMRQSPPPPIDRGWLNVRTGGTSGSVKFARHDEQSVGAAVRGFCRHFGIERVNAVDVLPAHHVSGLMARVRCAATGGRHLAWEWKRLESGDLPPLDGREWVLSLVPTQLQRLLASDRNVGWLRQLRVILVGGGPMWRDLADRAAGSGLRIANSYGMTETAAMIAAQRPEDFLGGDRSCGCTLPHARIAISAEDSVVVGGESLFRGYWPELSNAEEFVTGDLGHFDEQGRLHIAGRRDDVIITGGKKVHAAAVEAALRASGEFHDVAVIGIPDPEWGESVVACFAGDATPDSTRAVSALAGYQRPKRFVRIADWPRTPEGKLNRAKLRARVMEELTGHSPEPT